MITRVHFRGFKAHKLMSRLMTGLALVKIGLLIYSLGGDERCAVGRLTSVNPLRGSNSALVRVDAPILGDRLILLRTKPDERLVPGRWLLAYGDPLKVGRWTVLNARHVRLFPATPAPYTTVQGWQGLLPLPDLLAQHRGVALLLGATILLLGFVFMRLAAGVALGSVIAFVAWHAAVYASFRGWIELPNELLWGIVFLGFAIGAIAGYRGGTVVSYLAQRLAVILIFVAILDDIASYFGWPVELTRIVGILGTIISPAIGLWLIASYLLALGLKAQGAGIHLVLGAAGIIVHVLTRGRWIPGWSRYRLWRHRRRKAKHGPGPEISLAQLMGG